MKILHLKHIQFQAYVWWILSLLVTKHGLNQLACTSFYVKESNILRQRCLPGVLDTIPHYQPLKMTTLLRSSLETIKHFVLYK